MKRWVLVAVVVAVGAYVGRRRRAFAARSGLRCFRRGRHEPRRHPLGPHVCHDCGAAGADLDEMGFQGGGYVGTDRRTYERHNGAVTREAWEHTH